MKMKSIYGGLLTICLHLITSVSGNLELEATGLGPLILGKHILSKSKDGIKYLTCADCEVGPLGFHDPTEAPLRFLIAACRVKYDE